MLNPLEYQVANKEMMDVLSKQSTAGKQNEALSDESRKIWDDLYDKILLYSAGAFSFSVTLLGLVVNDKTIALSKVAVLFPNVYWMYGSMTSFLLAGGCVLLAKRFNANYIGAFGMRNYTETYLESEKVMLKMFQQYPDQFLITAGATVPEQIEVKQINITKLEKAVKNNKFHQENNYRLMHWLHVTSEIFAGVGTILLFFFAIQLSQALIWG